MNLLHTCKAIHNERGQVFHWLKQLTMTVPFLSWPGYNLEPWLLQDAHAFESQHMVINTSYRIDLPTNRKIRQVFTAIANTSYL
jgi:hypothetical protein